MSKPHSLGRRDRREAAWFYLLASPWLIGFLFLTIGPILQSVFYSLTSWRVIDTPTWVGLANYEKIVTRDPHFWGVLGNTLFYGITSVPLSLAVSWLLAALLVLPFRGRELFRILIYLPSILPVLVVGLSFQVMLRPEEGVVNLLLKLLGVEGPDWLNSEIWSKPALVLMNLWRIGFTVILFITSMRAVPRELYESAELDGAPWHTQQLKITLPILSPIILYNLVVGLIGSLKVFTEVYVLTGGGPYYSSQMMVPYILENAFQRNKFGYANAMAWLLFVVVALLSFLVIRRSDAWVVYETEVAKKRKP